MSSQEPILLTNKPCWDTLLSRVKGACIFVDDTVAECIHWSGSATILDEAGARSVRQFSSFETAEKNVSHVVFIVSSKITPTTQNILEDILKDSNFRDVLFVTTLPPAAHATPRGHRGHNSSTSFTDNEDAFKSLEQNILAIIDKPISTVEVIYLPLAYAPITDKLFYLPSCVDLFPLLPTDWKTLRHITSQSKLKSNTNIELSDFPLELQMSMKNLVYNLHSFLSHHDIGEDIFFVGETSKFVANEIASFPAAKLRRGAADNKASLLIVDRSLDITSAIGHHTDSLLDRIIRTLPRHCGGRNHADVEVNMGSIVHNDSGEYVFNGCLASSESFPFCRKLLTILAEKKQREAINEVYRSVGLGVLKEQLTNEKIKVSGRINADTIESQIKYYRKETKAIVKYCNTLTVGLAAVQTLRHPYSSRQDAMFGIEKGLLQSIGDVESSEALNTIRYKLLDNESEFSLDDILQLLIYFYGLCDMSEVTVEEKELMEALIEKIQNTERNTLSEDMNKLFYEGNRKLETVVKEIFYKLRGISTTRSQLLQYQQVYQGGDITSQATLNPILRQILDEALNMRTPSRDLIDIKHVSTGLKDILKTGLGFLMNRAAVRPNDQPLLIVFIIGGVTVAEARKMQEMSLKSDTQLLIGSTTISTPQNLLKMILIQDNLQTS